MQSVVETKAYGTQADRLLDEEERSFIAETLALNPTAGVLVPGGNGIRKLRVGFDGRGKRGGARVIYYHYDESVPLLLLYLFAKNERDDLSATDLAAWAAAVVEVKKAARRRAIR